LEQLPQRGDLLALPGQAVVVGLQEGKLRAERVAAHAGLLVQQFDFQL
jgi:hypothetical protein